MTLKDLIVLGDVREKQAFAMTVFFAGKVDNERLQNAVDAYCDNLAHSFISKYKGELQDKELLLGLRKHILSIGANKPHSGKRFYEALYKKLNDYENINLHNKPQQIK